MNALKYQNPFAEQDQGGLRFHFHATKSMEDAMEIFNDLGYQPQRITSDPQALKIRMEHNDLISALEIAQEHGGEMEDA